MSIINKIPEQLKDFYRKIFKRSDFGHFHSIALSSDFLLVKKWHLAEGIFLANDPGKFTIIVINKAFPQ